MKKTLAMLLCTLMLLCAGCAGGNNDPSSSGELAGSSSEALAQVLDGADYGETPALGEEALTAENCEGTLGLSAEDFEQYVTDGTLSYAQISAVAHLSAMLKCKDADSAVAVRDALAEKFNVHRWVCVIPERVFAVNAGEYVFFTASFTDYANALYESFTALAGEGVGETVEVTVD